MKRLTLLEANKPEKVQGEINELVDFAESMATVTKNSIGLGNVDNTADLDKPLSNPQKYYSDYQDTLVKAEAKSYAESVVAEENARATAYTDTEAQRAISAEQNLSARITAQEGLGGALTAFDFGTSTPTQEELTQYALTQISSVSDPAEIWNATHVTNLYDGLVWQLNNTQNTAPCIFEWVNVGSSLVSQATDETLGLVKGGEKIRVLPDGSLDTDPESIDAATKEQGAKADASVQKIILNGDEQVNNNGTVILNIGEVVYLQNYNFEALFTGNYGYYPPEICTALMTGNYTL